MTRRGGGTLDRRALYTHKYWLHFKIMNPHLVTWGVIFKRFMRIEITLQTINSQFVMCTSTYGYWAIFNCICTCFLRKHVKTTRTLHVWACDLFPNFKYTHCTWEMSWWVASFNRDSVSKLWIHTSSQEVYVSRRTVRPSSFSLFQRISIYSAQDSRYNLLTKVPDLDIGYKRRDSEVQKLS